MKKFAPLFVIIAASLWGFDGIILRPALYSLPVTLVVFVESSIVAILLTPIFYGRFREIVNLNKKDLGAFFLVALFGGAIGTMAITKALFYVNFVNLSIVVLLQKLQPIFAITLASIFLKERLSKAFFLWSAIAIIGAYFMTFGFTLPNLVTGDKTFEAAIYAIIASVSFASSTVFSKRALRNVSFQLGSYMRFLLSSVILLIFSLSLGEFSSFTEITSQQWGIFFLIALTTGGLALFLYYYGLKRITASMATICELAFPLTAVILEYIVHKNILSPVQWFGVLVLIFAIYKVTKLTREERPIIS